MIDQVNFYPEMYILPRKMVAKRDGIREEFDMWQKQDIEAPPPAWATNKSIFVRLGHNMPDF